ncbi:reductive dehalogenase [Candidatus Thorarchaeota archaeon]|nr:MAG: reductive dehalogenase [Candidatus Thorarchaeota archaeon]
MIIETSKCIQNECDHECVDACHSIHGEQAPLTVDSSSSVPAVEEDRCTECLACLRACPLEAIHIDTPHIRPRRQRKSAKQGNDSRVYETSPQLKQFPESDMIFARVHNDLTFENYGKWEFYGAEEAIARGTPGYSRFEHELTRAAWEYYDKRNLVEEFSSNETPQARRFDNESQLTEMVKHAAKFFGADLVGVAEIDPRWIYSTDRQGNPFDISDSMRYGIVMALEMDYDAIATSPSFTSSAETGLGYSRMAFVETELSAFIRRLGYTAIPCGNDIALSVPLAIDAGLGQYGRHGLLITREYGPRVRLAKVLTDMQLVPDRYDIRFCEAVIRFCEICGKCAEMCPSQSIPHERERTWKGETKSNNPGVKKWYVDVESCYDFWIQNGCDCSNCIRSCPFNKRNNWIHKAVTFIVERFPWLHKLVLAFDGLLGYGRQDSASRYWSQL